MAAAKLTARQDMNAYGQSVLVIEKKRGKLNLEEIGDFLSILNRESIKGIMSRL